MVPYTMSIMKQIRGYFPWVVSVATLVAVAYYLHNSGVAWTPALLVACVAACCLSSSTASAVGEKTSFTWDEPKKKTAGKN